MFSMKICSSKKIFEGSMHAFLILVSFSLGLLDVLEFVLKYIFISLTFKMFRPRLTFPLYISLVNIVKLLPLLIGG